MEKGEWEEKEEGEVGGGGVERMIWKLIRGEACRAFLHIQKRQQTRTNKGFTKC